MRLNTLKIVRRVLLAVGILTGTTILAPNTASAVEGTELNATTGIWAPLLPEFRGDSGDSIGGIVGLSGHHRFDGYRTSIEARVNYGITDTAEMFGFDALLRDTWSFGIGDLSAGAGYSQMNWNQEVGNSDIDSDYVGGKIIGGWETAFGRRPVWIDLSIGIYDLDGNYRGDGGAVVADISKTTTTYGVDIKTDFMCGSVPARAVFGVNVLSDMATWQNMAIGTEEAVVLTGGIELSLY